MSSATPSIITTPCLASLFRTSLFQFVALKQPARLLEQFAGGRIFLASSALIVVIAITTTAVATTLLLTGAPGTNAIVVIAACADAPSAG
jgi:hypothetical protein